MSFIDIFKQSVKSGFQNYATFKGRTSRTTFWCWVLFIALISTPFNILVPLDDASNPFLLGLSIVLGIFFLIPNMSMTFRRFHDIGLSAWWILGIIALVSLPISFIDTSIKFGFIPPVPIDLMQLTNWIIWIIFALIFLKKGDEKANKYGEPPVL